MVMKHSFTWLCLSLVVLTGCPSGDDDTADDDSVPMIDGGPPDASASCIEAEMHSDLTWIKANVFQRSCFFATSCHNNTVSAEANLTLTPDEAYMELVGVDSVQVPGTARVIPGDCQNSYIYQKITDGPAIPSNKDPMPPTFDIGGNWVPLCQQKIDAICRWIDMGALDN